MKIEKRGEKELNTILKKPYGNFKGQFLFFALCWSIRLLELELIQPHMTQKPVLRGEVDARALRV